MICCWIGSELNGVQFAVCKFFAGIYVHKTKFENSWVYLVL